MWEGIDKRRFPRANYPCRVEIFKKGRKKSFDTRTENIGQGGVCVILKDSLNKFSPVDLILYLEDGQPPIECDARVVWVVRHKDSFDTGIEFLDIKERDIQRIERIVQECLKNSQNSS